MKQRIRITALMALAGLLGSTALLAASDDAFARDLKVTIALQGLPCDEIASTQRNGDSDYVATCKDGNRYHIFVNPQGRVVVQKQ
jgi:hypothetical protein